MAEADFRFSTRQRDALTAIVDTFAPGIDGLPSASEHGVVDAIEEGVAANPRKAERRQVAQLLGLWDTALLTAVGGGGLKRFSALPQSRREDVLGSWRDSRAPQRRGAYQALRRAALLMYYMKPGPDGRSSPMWDRIGFPGPPGKADDAAEPALEPIVPDRTWTSTATWSSWARVRAVARRRVCSAPRVWTSWCSRPVTTCRRASSRAASSRATARST